MQVMKLYCRKNSTVHRHYKTKGLIDSVSVELLTKLINDSNEQILVNESADAVMYYFNKDSKVIEFLISVCVLIGINTKELFEGSGYAILVTKPGHDNAHRPTVLFPIKSPRLIAKSNINDVYMIINGQITEFV